MDESGITKIDVQDDSMALLKVIQSRPESPLKGYCMDSLIYQLALDYIKANL